MRKSASAAVDPGLLGEPPVRMRRRAFVAVQKILYWTGLPSLCVRCFGFKGARILLYHSVALEDRAAWIHPPNRFDPVLFEKQMRFLRRHRSVLTLRAIVDAVQEGRWLPAGSVCVTFDDGYKDNLEVAAPILAKYDIPAVLYLVTGEVSRGGMQWVDQLYSAFKHRTQNRLRWPGKEGQDLDLSTPVAAQKAYRRILIFLTAAKLQERTKTIEGLLDDLRPVRSPPALMLNWDEALELHRKYPRFEIGVHSANHLDLAIHADQAREEILGSVQDFKEKLGISPEHFAFPFSHYSAAGEDVLRELKLRSGVGGNSGMLVTDRENPYMLPRIDAPDSLSLLRLYTCGPYPQLLRKVFGKS